MQEYKKKKFSFTILETKQIFAIQSDLVYLTTSFYEPALILQCMLSIRSLISTHWSHSKHARNLHDVRFLRGTY